MPKTELTSVVTYVTITTISKQRDEARRRTCTQIGVSDGSEDSQTHVKPTLEVKQRSLQGRERLPLTYTVGALDKTN